MNLRLDATSIRLRLSVAEAIRLASELSISEDLPFFGDEWRLKISAGSEPGFGVSLDGKHIHFKLSKEKLETILNAVSKSARPKKEECEVKECQTLGRRSVEIRFEVDRLSSSR